VFGRRDGSTCGMHLKVLIIEPPRVVRSYDENTGLALIDLDASATGRSS
jgi:hypothetical protein